MSKNKKLFEFKSSSELFFIYTFRMINNYYLIIHNSFLFISNTFQIGLNNFEV